MLIVIVLTDRGLWFLSFSHFSKHLQNKQVITSQLCCIKIVLRSISKHLPTKPSLKQNIWGSMCSFRELWYHVIDLFALDSDLVVLLLSLIHGVLYVMMKIHVILLYAKEWKWNIDITNVSKSCPVDYQITFCIKKISYILNITNIFEYQTLYENSSDKSNVAGIWNMK